MIVQFMKGSERNTQCYIFRLAGIEFFISYNTIIAIRSDEGSVRLDNTWGPTTGQHMKEMGVKDFPIVDQETFQHAIRTSLSKMGSELIHLSQSAEIPVMQH
jgi:hypothetical protein